MKLYLFSIFCASLGLLARLFQFFLALHSRHDWFQSRIILKRDGLACGLMFTSAFRNLFLFRNGNWIYDFSTNWMEFEFLFLRTRAMRASAPLGRKKKTVSGQVYRILLPKINSNEATHERRALHSVGAEGSCCWINSVCFFNLSKMARIIRFLITRTTRTPTKRRS